MGWQDETLETRRWSGRQLLARLVRKAEAARLPIGVASAASVPARRHWVAILLSVSASVLLFALVFATRVLMLHAEAGAPRSLWTEPAAAASSGCEDASSCGSLRIESSSAAHVFVDGRRVGSTPQLTVDLTPGLHTVELVHPHDRLRKALVVDIDRGQLTTKNVDLTR